MYVCMYVYSKSKVMFDWSNMFLFSLENHRYIDKYQIFFLRYFSSVTYLLCKDHEESLSYTLLGSGD